MMAGVLAGMSCRPGRRLADAPAANVLLGAAGARALPVQMLRRDHIAWLVEGRHWRQRGGVSCGISQAQRRFAAMVHKGGARA